MDSPPESPEISVCLCTYKRSALLEKCLQSLLDQTAKRRFEVVIVDNDAKGTAANVAKTFVPRFETRGCELQYDIEPEQNIALARNRAVSIATGQYVAFLDDDEEAEEDWLEQLIETLIHRDSDAVFGPIMRVYPNGFPKSLVGAGIFEDPRVRLTGSTVGGTAGRTSNGLVKKSALRARPGPFDRELGRTGGEDTEFFCWLEQQGCIFCWCNEAIVKETIGTERACLGYNFRRGYSAGWLKARNALVPPRRFKSVVRVLSEALLGSVRNVVLFLFHLPNPRAAAVKLVRGIGSQVGKCGFLLGISVEQYRG